MISLLMNTIYHYEYIIQRNSFETYDERSIVCVLIYIYYYIGCYEQYCNQST